MSDLPEMHLNLGGESFTATPENASLYLYIGDMVSRSHVFLQFEVTDEDTLRGSYIFSAAGCFEKMAEYMSEAGYPLHVNLRDVLPCDEHAYQNYIDQNVAAETVPDCLPEDWL